MASSKKPITSADLGSVVESAAAGARQALAKGDLNGASVAMLTLSMAVANPSLGGAAAGAHVPAAAAAAAVPAAAEVLTAALDRAGAVEDGEGSDGEGSTSTSTSTSSDDALRAAVEAASISAGCLSALQFVLNESAEEGNSSSSSSSSSRRGGGATHRGEDLEALAALSRRLLEKMGIEFSSEGGSGGKSSRSTKNNPWTAKGALNNAASFAASLLEGFYGRRVDEEGEGPEAKEEKDGGGRKGTSEELEVVSPRALASILDAAAARDEAKQENIRLLAVDLACVVASSSAALGERLARWRKGSSGCRDGGGESSEKTSSRSSSSVVTALSKLLGSMSSSSPDFIEVRVRNLMALAMTMSAELRLDESKAREDAKGEEEEKETKSAAGEEEAPSLAAPGASARAALVSAPGAPAALVAAMKQSQDADAKAVARGLFEEVARAEDSKAAMVAALERAGVEKKVGSLSLA